MLKIYNPREAGMTIKFADGTNIEIAATGYNDFVKHDLKWAEFVHGRAIVKKVACCKESLHPPVPAASSLGRSVHPCPAGGC
jgi:hypothetical protein